MYYNPIIIERAFGTISPFPIRRVVPSVSAAISSFSKRKTK